MSKQRNKTLRAIQIAHYGGSEKEIESIYQEIENRFAKDNMEHDNFWKTSFQDG